MEYIDHYQNLEMDHVVDLEPFRMLITDRLTPQEQATMPIAEQSEPFLIASRMDYLEKAPRACKRSLIYRWGREGGWYAYDFLPQDICNAGYAKAFQINSSEYMAVLDRSEDPAEKLGKIVIFKWQWASYNQRVILGKSKVIAKVGITSEWSEQFDIFHIGDRTFVGAAQYRHATKCSSVKEIGDDCLYGATSVVYELTQGKALTQNARFKTATNGATKMKHLHAKEQDEHFLFISNSMDATPQRSTEGVVVVYRWSPEQDTFVALQNISAEGVTKLETFMLHGVPHVVFSSLVQQRVGQELHRVDVQFQLNVPIYRYDRFSREFVLEQAIQKNSSTGAKYMSICNEPILALTSTGHPQVDNPETTSYLYGWRGVLGFQPTLPISLNKVTDVEYIVIDGTYYILTASQDKSPTQTLKIVTR